MVAACAHVEMLSAPTPTPPEPCGQQTTRCVTVQKCAANDADACRNKRKEKQEIRNLGKNIRNQLFISSYIRMMSLAVLLGDPIGPRTPLLMPPHLDSWLEDLFCMKPGVKTKCKSFSFATWSVYSGRSRRTVIYVFLLLGFLLVRRLLHVLVGIMTRHVFMNTHVWVRILQCLRNIWVIKTAWKWMYNKTLVHHRHKL